MTKNELGAARGGSPIVTAVHSDPHLRGLLRAALQHPTRTVLTEYTWADLLVDPAVPAPTLILLDPSYIGGDCVSLLSLFRHRWPAAEILILSEALEVEGTRSNAMMQLLRQVDALLKTKPELQIERV